MAIKLPATIKTYGGPLSAGTTQFRPKTAGSALAGSEKKPAEFARERKVGEKDPYVACPSTWKKSPKP
jgi:hypothetical protein